MYIGSLFKLELNDIKTLASFIHYKDLYSAN